MNVRWMMTAAAMVMLLGVAGSATAQDSRKPSAEIFLEDEELDVQADLPSVDFVLNFKELRYEGMRSRDSFLKEIFETVEREPF